MTKSEIANIVFPHRQFLVGFSGGLDSTVLLHRLKLWRDQEQNIKIRAVHVHHGLSHSANIWVKHCVELCSEWKIPLIVVRVSIVKEGLGMEAQARKARYKAFKEILLPNEVLVTAHHLDDQCKTFLLALKRGSGPAGLSAMPIRKKFSSTYFLRPLLNESRESIMIWAKEHHLKWVEDESNKDDYYDRNFLHLHIIPLLIKRWPHISFSVARSASLCAEQERLLDELLADELLTLISKEGAIKIAPLGKMSAPHRNALLRRWLSKQGALMPSRSMLNRLWKEVAQARRSSAPCLNLNGYNVHRFQGMLWRIKKQHPCKNTVLLWKNPNEPLLLPYGNGKVFLKKGGHISFPNSKETISVRFKTTNIIHTDSYHKGRKLKKIWQELNVPPWERSTIPLLFYDETLIAAAGKFITKEGWVRENGISFERDIASINSDYVNNYDRY